jgi:hypothetical protein
LHAIAGADGVEKFGGPDARRVAWEGPARKGADDVVQQNRARDNGVARKMPGGGWVIRREVNFDGFRHF